MRHIILDTETTGLDPAQGHRIIEIGAVELVNRRPTGRHFHHYLQPDRDIDPGAMEVHGITAERLVGQPRFREIVDALLAFVAGAEVVIHNARFDVGFLNHELTLLNDGRGALLDYCTVFDTLVLARRLHPGQKNNLDALCKRYTVDNTQRTLHGALLDAQILAEVYLAMTGGQASLALEGTDTDTGTATAGPRSGIRRLATERPPLAVIRATADERTAHEARLAVINKASGGRCVWPQAE